MKYEYSCLNIYSGKWVIVKSNNYYEKETILKGEYACKECKEIKSGYRCYTYYYQY